MAGAFAGTFAFGFGATVLFAAGAFAFFATVGAGGAASSAFGGGTAPGGEDEEQAADERKRRDESEDSDLGAELLHVFLYRHSRVRLEEKRERARSPAPSLQAVLSPIGAYEQTPERYVPGDGRLTCQTWPP